MIKRKNNFKYIILLVILISSIAISPAFAGQFVDDEQEKIPDPVRGKVIEILSEEAEQIEGFSQGDQTKIQTVEIKITSGEHKDETIMTENVIDERFAYNLIVKEGDRVLLFLEEDVNGDIIAAYIDEIERDRYLLFLVLAFVLSLILVGGLKGLKAVITLGLTGFAILKIYLPLTLKGYSPILLSIGISIGVIIFTLLVISGINKKTMSAIVGTTGGVLIAGIITLIVGSFARLTGLGNEEAQMLMFIPQEIDFNFKGILFSGIILGALGAVMDVSMSIASSINEIEIANPELSTKELFKAGMNVGRDIMGTMSNTLILAYTGSSIYLMLLFLAYDFPFVSIINRDMIASEVVRALAGSIGLICTVPLTAIISATIGRKRKAIDN